MYMNVRYGEMTVETCRNVRFRVPTSVTGCTRLRKEFIVLTNICKDGLSLAVFTLNSRMWCRYVSADAVSRLTMYFDSVARCGGKRIKLRTILPAVRGQHFRRDAYIVDAPLTSIHRCADGEDAAKRLPQRWGTGRVGDADAVCYARLSSASLDRGGLTPAAARGSPVARPLRHQVIDPSVAVHGRRRTKIEIS